MDKHGVKHTEEELAWLAGWLDGEGYFGVGKSGCRIQVANTHKPTQEYTRDHFGGAVYQHNRTRRKANWRPQYRWQVNGADAARISRLVLPYLHEKQRQAEMLIEWWELGGGSGKRLGPEAKQRRAEIKEEITRLKHIAFSKRKV